MCYVIILYSFYFFFLKIVFKRVSMVDDRSDNSSDIIQKLYIKHKLYVYILCGVIWEYDLKCRIQYSNHLSERCIFCRQADHPDTAYICLKTLTQWCHT